MDERAVAWFSGFPVVVRKAQDWRVGVDRGLPVKQTTSWDGARARDQIFRWAGWPDDPDPSAARRCFVFYDASNPEEMGGYKHPVCIISGGKPVVSSAGLVASLTRLAGTRGPGARAKERARAVVEYFEDKLEKVEGEGAGLRGGKE